MREKLELKIDDKHLLCDKTKLEKIKQELELFLKDNNYMNSIEFYNNVVFSQEIKSNNTIEGYNDDVGLVYDIINNKIKIKDMDKLRRIKNLYNGYRFISTKKEINKDNLKELYSILSNGLLNKFDMDNMGKYYRLCDVYIYYSDRIDIPPDKGMDVCVVEDSMDELIRYMNNNTNIECNTDYFIKALISHFQFVSIHPYYDINGRTSRTCSMWYLLNNEAYPYIIFNRAISLNKNMYYKIIRETKEHKDVTYFIKYLLDSVKLELEKEYIMDMIKSNSNHLTAVDYQTMYYMLSMNGLITLKDFTQFYNRKNDKKKINEIYDEMILPLIEKDVIIKSRDTSSYINSKDKNFVIKLNDKMYDYDKDKIKKLIIK